MARRRLIGSYWTLAVGADPMGSQHCPHDFRDRVAAASAAGFTGMGFWHNDLVEILRHHSLSEMKSVLDDHGIVDIELEWLLEWYCDDDRRRTSDATRKLLLDAAEALGARHIKVGDLDNDCADVPRMTDEFALLCQQAADRGTNMLFEMLPPQFSRAPSLAAAFGIARGAGQKNGGVMLDNLHVYRCGISFDELAAFITPDDLIGVEINDGYLGMPKDFTDSVVNKRLLPGDGEFDISGFLHAIWSVGFDGPIGVEVLNQYVRLWTLETAASQAFDKTATAIELARA